MRFMYLKYLRQLLRHKYFVFIECCRLGVPFLGIIHDWSKFLPDEFLPYARYFYGDKDAGKDGFDRAWLKHQRRNKHHWQWWLLIQDDDPAIMIEMPLRYRKEMIADWRGAGRAYTGKDDSLGWYSKKREKISLHPTTRRLVEVELGYKGDKNERII